MSDPGLLVLSRSDIARLMAYEDYLKRTIMQTLFEEPGRELQ